ncbi:hypothetical protein AALB39_04480 [Lachnospiraceae bacterium 54-53]
MKEWYLIGSPSLSSGFENEILDDYKSDSFAEIANSNVGESVIFFNHDMTISYETRAIFQNKTADSDTNAVKRQVLANIGTLNLYHYIKGNDGIIWLLKGKADSNGIYDKCTANLCNYKLFWQNGKGDIISRYAHVLNASSYNNGESENKTMTLLSNQYMVYLPFDEDTELLDNEKRIHMAKSNRKCRPYELTRVDDIAYDYTDKGIINLMFTQDEYSSEHDKLVDDGTGNKVWICDYKEPSTPPSPTDPGDNGNQSPILLQAKFSCKGDKIIKAGGSAKTFSVEFTDENGVTVSDISYTWSISITKEFEDLLSVETLTSGQCRIKLGYDDLVIGNYVRLSVLNNEGKEIGYELIEIGGNL